MAKDPTENIRRVLVQAANADQSERAELEASVGQVWSTEELGRDYDVLGFMAPYVVVRRKVDGVKGSLLFQHRPRYYYGWQEDK